MLVATDYDGTLNINGSISPHVRDAIDSWRAKGRYFGVVTGRGIDFYDTAAELKIAYDFLILCNGSLILSAKKEILFESLIPDSTFSRIEKAMASYPDILNFSRSDGKPRHHYYAEFPDADRALEVREEILPLFADRLSIFVNGPHINIGNKGTGKSQAVDFMLRYYSLASDSAAVVGDDYNDLEMITAHDGWAVDSGKPEVLKQAPHLCRDVGDLIDRLL